MGGADAGEGTVEAVEAIRCGVAVKFRTEGGADDGCGRIDAMGLEGGVAPLDRNGRIGLRLLGGLAHKECAGGFVTDCVLKGGHAWPLHPQEIMRDVVEVFICCPFAGGGAAGAYPLSRVSRL